MGCGSSKEAQDDPMPAARPQVITVTKQGVPVMVPNTYRDGQGRPIKFPDYDLDRATILRAFEQMAIHLTRRNVTARIVTVGGAVNTIYLQSRQSTHDVDFFLGDPTSPQYKVLGEAARAADRQTGGKLGMDWFNNSTQLFMEKRIQQELFDTAFDQNAIVFQQVSSKGGLVVYAAPWQYALCGKLGRMSKETRRPYDVADATVYLHEYLRMCGQQTIGANQIRAWGARYKVEFNDAVIQQLDQTYTRQFNRRPIDWRS